MGLTSTGLDLHFGDSTVLHYDLKGRLLRVGQPNVHWRRGLSGRTMRLRRARGQRAVHSSGATSAQTRVQSCCPRLIAVHERYSWPTAPHCTP